MSAQKVIIDCDPGIDDALALVFARGHPDLEVLGITTVAGNVGLGQTTANALQVRDYLTMPDVPVVAGSPGPLLRPALDARDVHGSSGLGAASLPAPSSGPADGHAVDYLAAAIGAEPGQVTLIAIGPLTNIALAVRRYPRLVTQVRDFVIMGGSAGPGDVTPGGGFHHRRRSRGRGDRVRRRLARDHGRPGRDAEATGPRRGAGPDARPRQARRRPAAAEPVRLPRRQPGGRAGGQPAWPARGTGRACRA